MTPEELTASTAAPINVLGAKYYFDGPTLAAGKQLGLDGFRFYVLGRGGVLGDVAPAVITSAFGYFHPNSIAKIWDSGREIVAPSDATKAALQCNADLARAHLGDVAELGAFCQAAEAVIDDVNPAALALYAGFAAESLPDDLAARALQLIVVHRELRGGAHLAAIVSAGIHPGVAHAIRRPNDIENFGWPADIAITDNDRAKLATVDRVTNDVSAGHYSCLTSDQCESFVAGIGAIGAAFDA